MDILKTRWVHMFSAWKKFFHGNYGDFDNIENDVKTIHNIISRQGTILLADCIAEHIGQTSLKFDLSFDESKLALKMLIQELEEQTLERL